MVVVQFKNSLLGYYLPQEILSQESYFSIIPQEKILIEIQPPIYDQWKHNLCVQIKNTSNKILLVQPQSTLFNILNHPHIQHYLVYVAQPVINYMKRKRN